MAFVLIGAMVVLFLLSARFGVDSRPGVGHPREEWFGARHYRALGRDGPGTTGSVDRPRSTSPSP